MLQISKTLLAIMLLHLRLEDKLRDTEDIDYGFHFGPVLIENSVTCFQPNHIIYKVSNAY